MTLSGPDGAKLRSVKGILKHLEGIATSSPRVMGGTIVFEGTRVPVVSLLDHLSGGEALDVYLTDYPGVSREQAEAFLNRLSCVISPEMYEVVSA